MKISWILSEEIKADTLDMSVVREVAPAWGSWKVWQNYKIDNCVCTDIAEAKNLIGKAFHAVCNFYIMEDHYTEVGSPVGAKIYKGYFKNDNIHNKDDIVALNLAVPTSDIVLMSGFNFSPLTSDDTDREEYYYNVRELIKTHSNVQFVLVDYEYELASWTEELDNLTQDTIHSVKSLLF
jgi:hypothetical protein